MNDRQILHLKNDGDEQYIEDYFEDNEVLATIQDMADCFKLGKTINQYKRLCSDVCPYFTNYTIEEETYSEIEEQQDDGYNSDNEVAELNFDQKDSEFLHDFSLANESIRRNQSQKPILKSNMDSELHPEVDTKELIQKLGDFATTADLDVTTLVEEQLNVPVLRKVRSWIKKSDKRPTKTHDINQSKALLSYFNRFEQLFIGEETNLLCYNETVQETNKTEISPSSNSNNHCLVLVDAFSRFIGVYPVKDTSAQATITALEKWITSYGIPQKIIHDNSTAFINSDFINWTKEFGFTLAPRTTYSPWTNGKVEVQNQHLTRYWRNFTNEPLHYGTYPI